MDPRGLGLQSEGAPFAEDGIEDTSIDNLRCFSEAISDQFAAADVLTALHLQFLISLFEETGRLTQLHHALQVSSTNS